MVRFEFRLRRRAWVINVMNLLVQTVPHDERIRERQSMRFHRVAFLKQGEQENMSCTTFERTAAIHMCVPRSDIRRHPLGKSRTL